jgi:hypothetical protein
LASKEELGISVQRHGKPLKGEVELGGVVEVVVNRVRRKWRGEEGRFGGAREEDGKRKKKETTRPF